MSHASTYPMERGPPSSHPDTAPELGDASQQRRKSGLFSGPSFGLDPPPKMLSVLCQGCQPCSHWTLKMVGRSPQTLMRAQSHLPGSYSVSPERCVYQRGAGLRECGAGSQCCPPFLPTLATEVQPPTPAPPALVSQTFNRPFRSPEQRCVLGSASPACDLQFFWSYCWAASGPLESVVGTVFPLTSAPPVLPEILLGIQCLSKAECFY